MTKPTVGNLWTWLLGLTLVGGLWAASAAAQQDQSDRSDQRGQSSDRQRNAQNRSDYDRSGSNQSGSNQYRPDRSPDQSSDRQSGDRRSSDRQPSDRQSGERQSDQDSSHGTAWLGVYLNEDQSNQQNGALVAHIYPAGPAARAGLLPGDLITSVNGQRIKNSSDLMNTVEQQRAGSRASLPLRATINRSTFLWCLAIAIALGSTASTKVNGAAKAASRGRMNSPGWDRAAIRGPAMRTGSILIRTFRRSPCSSSMSGGFTSRISE